MLTWRKISVCFTSVFFILMFFITNQGQAQYYSTGQNPSSIKWRQINTSRLKLIYPDYYEENARWLAAYLDSASSLVSHSLNYQPGRIPLVLHTQSATSNAVVSWAPKRMEFYSMPPQDMYAQPWLEQLSIHEYRHVVQIEKLNQGLTRVISWLFGQQGTAAILGLYIPPWFLEGDAVATETGLSLAGRGRVPLFEMELRAQLLERGMYSYDKAVLGSYRDFISDQYVLGYHLVAEGRRLYGPRLWEHVLNRVARRPYMVTPFQKGIRDISGKRKIPFYEECMTNLSNRWEMQEKTSTIKVQAHQQDPAKHYTSYRHPVYHEDGSILAMKSGIDDIIRFVKISGDGQEKRVFTPGLIKSESLSYSRGKLCWAETHPDPRWANRSYTFIKILDVDEGEVETIRHKRRYLAPVLSGDATKIAVVSADSLDRFSIVILDPADGQVIKEIDTEGNNYPLTPAWAGGDKLLTIQVSDRGKSLQRIDIQSGKSEILLPWTYIDISQPIYHEPFIYFVGSWSGISNIYRLDPESGNVDMMTRSRFGAVDPHLSSDGNALLFADYRASGYRIAETDPAGVISATETRDESNGLASVLAEQETLMPPGSSFKPSGSPSRKYSKIGNLFNFHSWAPLDINANNYTINPGISIMSQNLLSSSFLSLGYNYNVNEQLGKLYGTYTYAGWYPMIDLSFDYGLRRDFAYLPKLVEIKWQETNLRAGLRLPLNLTRGKYFSGLLSYVYANQIIRRIQSPDSIAFKKPDIFSTWYGVRYYRQLKTSLRDIYPRWGQSLGLYYRHTPFESSNTSDIAAVVLNMYFPGILRHHGINIYAGYQQREIGYYKFSDLVAYPRGYTGLQHEELYSLRTTYAFPVAYPDWSVGPVLYLKRIRANLFYDYALGRNSKDYYYNSIGADLLVETHILRFYAPVEMGVRAVYLPDYEQLEWQFLISVGFDSFYVGNENRQAMIP